MGDLDTMTDPEAKAWKLAALYVKAGPIFASKTLGEASDLLATAIREARSQALEEAAGVAMEEQNTFPIPRSYEHAHVCIGIEMAADRIRAIKEEYGASPAMAVLDEVQRDNAEKADDLRSALKDTTP